jgi:hypothetical protein
MTQPTSTTQSGPASVIQHQLAAGMPDPCHGADEEEP